MLKSKLRTAKVDLHHGLKDMNSLVAKNDSLTRDTCELLVENEDYEYALQHLERRNN